MKLPARENGRIRKPKQATVDRLVAYHEKRLGRAVCGAWRPVKGDVCCRWPMRGRERCESCGGKTPRGVESPQFKIGIFSKALGDTPMAETYHRILNDKRLMDLREHIGLSTSVLMEMVAELFAGVPPRDLWDEARALSRQIQAASAAGDDARATGMILRLLDVVDAGADLEAKREEIRRQQDLIRKLNTTERRHQEKERELMSMEAFHVNMAILAESLELFFETKDIARWKRYMQQNVMGLPKGSEPVLAEATVLEAEAD